MNKVPDTPKAQSYSLPVAERIGKEICDMLADSVERIAIAGSVRRRCKVVHDLDIVAIPRFSTVPARTLFGDPELISELNRVLDELVSKGRIEITSRGDKAVRFRVGRDSLTVDLYIASSETWATLMLIRTGSREHNISLCNRARTLGMQLKADGSGLFRGGQLIASDSEESIFQALKLKYSPPEQRR